MGGFIERKAWQPKIRPARKVEALRHHTHDSAREAIERDRFAENVRIGAQTISPELITQNGDGRRFRPLFVRREIASQQRLHAHQTEEGRRRGGDIQPFRPFDPGPIESRWIAGSDLLENPVLIAQQEVIGRGADLLLRGPGACADPIDAVGVGVGKRADENGIGYAEHRGIGADADRQR